MTTSDAAMVPCRFRSSLSREDLRTGRPLSAEVSVGSQTA
jgi:hypothetical protein